MSLIALEMAEERISELKIGQEKLSRIQCDKMKR